MRPFSVIESVSSITFTINGSVLEVFSGAWRRPAISNLSISILSVALISASTFPRVYPAGPVFSSSYAGYWNRVFFFFLWTGFKFFQKLTVSLRLVRVVETDRFLFWCSCTLILLCRLCRIVFSSTFTCFGVESTYETFDFPLFTRLKASESHIVWFMKPKKIRFGDGVELSRDPSLLFTETNQDAWPTRRGTWRYLGCTKRSKKIPVGVI